ncbi:MFS transporter [Nocardia xishanensis]|uniref:MFS transporter n=1 Tax=Nocardia xishanensis TaxID=238964 RepID=A0ABW7XB86_9NOCA
MTPSSEPTATVAEATFIATAAGNDDPPPLARGSVNRLLAWVFPANLVLFLLWGSIPGLFLPRQLELLDPDDKVANLGTVTSLGAFGAMIAAPIIGQVSDRTRSRFGRRAPWIVVGALAGTLALIGLAFANSYLAIAIAWPLVQIFYNVAQGPLSTILPDRIPRRRRGAFAAVAGIGGMSGALLGSIVGSMLYDSITVGYLFFAAIALVVLILFVAFNPDHSSVDVQVEPFRAADFLRTFWVDPVEHPDFFWAFIGRLLLFTGYGLITGYQLYLLTDYVHLENPQTVIPVIGVVGLVGIIIGTVISGPLSDKVGRRKPFVFGASLVMGLALVLPWARPTLTSWLIMTGVLALGFGMYGAVDQALMVEVLPSAQSFGKDLGLVNIAAALPQTIAPAIASAVVLMFGYAGLFPLGIALSLLGAFAVWPIKSVR